MEISLYLHIPFCLSKCDYCDFYSVPPGGSLEQWRDEGARLYVDALLAETERRFAGLEYSVPTLYIGGGTPSLLGAAGMARLLDGLSPKTGSCREITVEANPETADTAFLRSCADHGVTRLSLGVQSFCPAARKAAGRRGELVPEHLDAAAKIFGSFLSLDLITGLPFQDAACVLADVERALSYNPGHISLYSLTVEQGTPLAARRAAEERPAAGDDDTLWLAGRDALIRAGYEQYEVSNFALPGRRCAHNIRYWRMENWIGVGPAASGTMIDGPLAEVSSAGLTPDIPAGNASRGRRTGYAADTEAFLADPSGCITVEELDTLTLIKESLLMGFRYSEGPDRELFRRRFGLDLEAAVPRTLEKWRQMGLTRPGKTALSPRGMLLLNRFLLDCFEELSSGPSFTPDNPKAACMSG
ncbi:MAG: coproporphyrinogen III oxidase family protein [Treponema sp.]|nr:coproporphyrinogen III oxidase family protein [Treponema sp.]